MSFSSFPPADQPPSGGSRESPFGAAPGFPPQEYGHPPAASRLSMLAVTSLVTAIIAPILSCLCIPTIVLAAISTGTGILSIYKINLSEGRMRGLPLAAE